MRAQSTAAKAVSPLESNLLKPALSSPIQLKHTKDKTKTNRQLKETSSRPVEVEAIKKIQIEEILEMKNLGKRTGTTEACFTNKICWERCP